MTLPRSVLADDANFDEHSYLVQNPDIADHVGSGHDCWSHFDAHGRGEGRQQADHARLRNVAVIQTSDTFKYPTMLAVTSATAIEFCRRKGYQYEMTIGLQRGYWGWQAIYNRILLLKQKVDQEYRGWIVYMDADAYVSDLDFDLDTFIRERADRAAIFVPALEGAEPWNINDGVFLVNLGHEEGRRLVALWHAAFMALSDDWLRANRIWSDGLNDQDMVQDILRRDHLIGEAVLIDHTNTINSTSASFIRQALRAQFEDFGSRVAWLRQATAAVFDRDARKAPWRESRA